MKDAIKPLTTLPLEDLARRMELTAALLKRQQEEEITLLVPITASEQQEAEAKLIGDQARSEWLQQKGWSEDDLRLCAARPLALQAFAQQQFGPGLEETFLSSRGARDEIVYSMIRLRDQGLSRELYLRLAEGELTFPDAARHYGEGPEARHQGVCGPVAIGRLQPPQLADALRALKPGELARPLALGEWQLLLRLEHFTPARLDDGMRRSLLQEQLDAFLDDRVRRIQAGQSLEAIRFDPVPERSDTEGPQAEEEHT